MGARAAILWLVVSSSGCLQASLVTFPPANRITSIEVNYGFASDDSPKRTIRDPQRIERVLAFLHDKEGKWEQSTTTPDVGKYHIAFVGDDIHLFMTTGNQVLQVQGVDYACHYKNLSEADQNQLLDLLQVERPATDPTADVRTGGETIREQSPEGDELETLPASALRSAD